MVLMVGLTIRYLVKTGEIRTFVDSPSSIGESSSLQHLPSRILFHIQFHCSGSLQASDRTLTSLNIDFSLFGKIGKLGAI